MGYISLNFALFDFIFILMVGTGGGNLYSCGENPAIRFVLPKRKHYACLITNTCLEKKLLMFHCPHATRNLIQAPLCTIYFISFLEILQLRVKFKTAMVSCSRCWWIRNYLNCVLFRYLTLMLNLVFYASFPSCFFVIKLWVDLSESTRDDLLK